MSSITKRVLTTTQRRPHLIFRAHTQWWPKNVSLRTSNANHFRQKRLTESVLSMEKTLIVCYPKCNLYVRLLQLITEYYAIHRLFYLGGWSEWYQLSTSRSTGFLPAVFKPDFITILFDLFRHILHYMNLMTSEVIKEQDLTVWANNTPKLCSKCALIFINWQFFGWLPVFQTTHLMHKPQIIRSTLHSKHQTVLF